MELQDSLATSWACRLLLTSNLRSCIGKQRSWPDFYAPQMAFLLRCTGMCGTLIQTHQVQVSLKLIHRGVSAESAIENISKSTLSTSCEEVQCIDHEQDSVVKNTMWPMTRTTRNQRRDKKLSPQTRKTISLYWRQDQPRKRTHKGKVPLLYSQPGTSTSPK
jgi:hypothetical protein